MKAAEEEGAMTKLKLIGRVSELERQARQLIDENNRLRDKLEKFERKAVNAVIRKPGGEEWRDIL
jgi:hypothetical protein